MKAFWHEIHQSLSAGEHVVVATIVSHSGSTPRTSGSKMVVFSDGRSSGTIGGGPVEADVVKSAMTVFTSHNSVIKSYSLNKASGVAEMDLICGGQLQVLVEYIPSEDNTIEMYRNLNNAVYDGKSGLWVGRILKKREPDNLEVERSLQIDNGLWIGPLQPSMELQQCLKRQSRGPNITSLLDLEGQQYVLDSITPPKTAYLIGAGHVAKEIAPLAHRASFRIVVVDDRAEYANTTRFPYADKVAVCPDCTEPFEGFRVDKNSYIIIVTRGHSFDKEALAQALRTDADYIGMIGSRKKRDQIYKNLLDEGFTPSQLERVHCPIGLSINAETPFEIAVSIIAELIRHRARGNSS
ncbi:MAG: XdhC family aldehyde oxidoreductase maturation factor [Desulforhopalus sp.]